MQQNIPVAIPVTAVEVQPEEETIPRGLRLAFRLMNKLNCLCICYAVFFCLTFVGIPYAIIYMIGSCFTSSLDLCNLHFVVSLFLSISQIVLWCYDVTIHPRIDQCCCLYSIWNSRFQISCFRFPNYNH